MGLVISISALMCGGGRGGLHEKAKSNNNSNPGSVPDNSNSNGDSVRSK